MKRISALSAVFLLAMQNFYGQCNVIIADKTLGLGGTSAFTVDTKAQCDECYSWKSSNEQVLKIEGSNKLSKVNFTANSVGKSNISVSIFTDQGLVQCEKSISITDLKQNPTENSCGINIDDFKDVKVSESVIAFFPNFNSTDYTYKWTVTYSNGESTESADKIPQFAYSDNNYITSVKLRITNNALLCAVTLTKKYDQNYWKAPKNIVEQRVYSPGGYTK